MSRRQQQQGSAPGGRGAYGAGGSSRMPHSMDVGTHGMGGGGGGGGEFLSMSRCVALRPRATPRARAPAIGQAVADGLARRADSRPCPSTRHAAACTRRSASRP